MRGQGAGWRGWGDCRQPELQHGLIFREELSEVGVSCALRTFFELGIKSHNFLGLKLINVTKLSLQIIIKCSDKGKQNKYEYNKNRAIS